MLGLTTATQPTNEISEPQCNVTTIVTGTQDYCRRQQPYSMNSSGLKTNQLHPCTVCTCISDIVCWPVSCFAHNLVWRAHQLVHTGDESASKFLRGLIQRDP